MRLLHAVVGLLTIAACYVLFRQLLPRGWAFLGALLVGVNHAMFMISRLAMRENTAVFVLVVALILLVWGLRQDQELAIFLGGFVAGLGFYVYYPARVVFPIWIVFLIGLGSCTGRRFAPRQLADVGAVTAAGLRARGDADHLLGVADPGRRPKRPGRQPLHLQRGARASRSTGCSRTASSAAG